MKCGDAVFVHYNQRWHPATVVTTFTTDNSIRVQHEAWAGMPTVFHPDDVRPRLT